MKCVTSALWEATDLQDVDFGLAVSAGDPLAVAGNVLVVPLGLYGSAGTLAIDAGTGREVWRADGSAPGELISDGQPFHGEGAGVVAVDPTTGATLWQAAADTSGTRWLESATTFADGTAVALGFGGEGAETVVVDAATGAVRWQVETASGGLAHLDGVTVVSSDTSLRGYDAEGVRLWTTDLPASGQQYDDDETPWEGDMVVAGGKLYFLGLDLVALDVTAGAAEIVTPRSSPSDVVSTASHLVVPGQVWEARPL